MQKEYREYYDRKYIFYDPFWYSFNSLKLHLIKENESIEIMEIVG